VLDDGDRRRVELGDELEGRIGVIEIIVGELLALHLLGRRDPVLARIGDIERCRLMGFSP